MFKHILYTGLDPSNYKKNTNSKITHLPLIKIVPVSPDCPFLSKALNNFALYTHIIVTSKTSIKFLLDYLPQDHNWRDKKTIAVGSATANSLIEIGIKPFIIAKEENAEGIIKELDSNIVLNNSMHFFWPHSAQARPILIDYFKEKTINFTHCSLYDTHTACISNLPSLDQFDEIVFTSPSTVKAFLSLFGNLPSNKILTPIGPITNKFLNDIHFLA